MANRVLLPLVLILVALLPKASAQDPFAIQYKTEQGWPSNICYDIIQDERGYIWHASNEGLSRFDGVEHLAFNLKSQQSRPGSNIKEDRWGRVWYETFDGFIYYYENDKLHALNQNPPVDFFHFDLTQKHVFVFQQKGIDVFDLETLSLILTIPLKLDGYKHAKAAGDMFYFIFFDKFYQINSDLQVKECAVFPDSNAFFLIQERSEGAYVISNGAEQDELFFFNKNGTLTHSVPIENLSSVQGTNCIGEEIWIHTSNGSIRFEKEESTLLSDYKGVFEGFSISSSILDRQGNYWFSTIDKGVLFCPDFGNKKLLLPNTAVKAIQGDNAQSIVITGDRTIKKLDSDFRATAEIQLKANPYFLFHDTIDDILFVSSQGFSVYDANSFKELSHFEIAMKSIVRLDEEYYAFAASGFCGLFKNPKCDPSFVSKWDDLFSKNEHEFSEISYVLRSVRGKWIDYNPINSRIYVAANTGLFEISPTETNELLNGNASIYSTKVVVMKDQLLVQDTNRELGLYKNGKLERWSKWKEDLGEVSWVKKIGQQLIIGSENILRRYNFDTQEYSEDIITLQSNRVNDVEVINGDMYLALDGGLLFIPPNKKLSGKAVPLFHINTISNGGLSFPWKENFSEKWSDNRITIGFSVLDFGEFRNHELSYRINGGDWIPVATNQRWLEFSALAHGSYLLQFQLNGELSGESIQFEITAPFYKKSWFYILIGLIAIMILALYFRWQIMLMRTQVVLLKEKVELEKSLGRSLLTSIKSQMNPHFFYNALNTIQAYIFTNDRQNATLYLSKFSKLTRLILEMSEKESIRLSEEVKALTLYIELEAMRFQEDFEYHILVEEALDQNAIHIPSMLIQPYVENAIKHGLHHLNGKKKLNLKFVDEGNQMKVVVEDNGIGRKRAEELNKINYEKRASFSTDANQKRLDVLNRNTQNKISVVYVDKVDEFGNSVGTAVTLNIPKG